MEQSDKYSELVEQIALLENKIKEDKIIVLEEQDKSRQEYEELLNNEKKEINDVKELLELERELCDGLEKKVKELNYDKELAGEHEIKLQEYEQRIKKTD